MSIRLYTALGIKLINLFPLISQHTFEIYVAIIVALRLKHTMTSAVSEAEGRKLAEGQRGRRPSQCLVPMRFILTFISVAIICIRIDNLSYFSFITKWVKKFVPVPGTVLFIYLHSSFLSLHFIQHLHWSQPDRIIKTQILRDLLRTQKTASDLLFQTGTANRPNNVVLSEAKE